MAKDSNLEVKKKVSLLLATWQLINDQDFRGRIAVSIFKASENILNEGGDPEAPRAWLAEQVKIDPSMRIDWFVWKVSSNSSIATQAVDGQGNVPDGDVDYVVASVWDAVAIDRASKAEPMGGTTIPTVQMPNGPVPVAPPVTVIG